MKRRTLLVLAAAGCALTAITYGATGSTSAPQRAAAEVDSGCVAAGERAAVGAVLGTTPRSVAFGGTTMVFATELNPGDRPAELVGAVASSQAAGVIAAVIDAKGPDRLLLSTDAGAAWTQVADAPDIGYPAVSPAGGRAAWSAGGTLTIATLDNGIWKTAAIAPPGDGKQFAEYIRFLDEDRLLLSVEVGVPGVDPDFAALSDVWTYRHSNRAWTRLTSGTADADRWSLAKTPVMGADGSVLYVRQTGLGSGTGADIRTELRRVSGTVDSVVAELPDRWGLAAVDATGAMLWNAPDDRSQWQLIRSEPDGAKTTLGCARGPWAPVLNHDPDYTP